MFLLALSMVVTVSGPPLSPEEALRVLRASRSELDRTYVMTLSPEQRPVWVSTQSKTWRGSVRAAAPPAIDAAESDARDSIAAINLRKESPR
jgi:hypothetical protein